MGKSWNQKYLEATAYNLCLILGSSLDIDDTLNKSSWSSVSHCPGGNKRGEVKWPPKNVVTWKERHSWKKICIKWWNFWGFFPSHCISGTLATIALDRRTNKKAGIFFAEEERTWLQEIWEAVRNCSSFQNFGTRLYFTCCAVQEGRSIEQLSHQSQRKISKMNW